jgi:tetratricopeptide (TPR) repeat protein
MSAHGALRPEWQLAVAHAHFWAGSAAYRRGDVAAAAAHFEPFVRVSEALVAANPDSASYRRELAYALSNIGSAREARGDVAGALDRYRRALRLRGELLRRAPGDADARRDLALAHNTIGVAERKAGRLAAAVDNHVAEVALRAGVVDARPTDADARRGLANAHFFLALARLAAGDPAARSPRPRGPRRAGRARRARPGQRHVAHRPSPRRQPGAAAARPPRRRGRGARRRRRAALAGLAPLAGPHARRARAARADHRPDRPRPRPHRLGRPATRLDAARAAVADGEQAPRAPPPTSTTAGALADAYLALGEDPRPCGGNAVGRAAARSARVSPPWTRRPGHGLTELLALRASALLDLGRADDARAAVAELARRGYGHPAYAARLGATPAEPSGRRAAARAP